MRELGPVGQALVEFAVNLPISSNMLLWIVRIAGGICVFSAVMAFFEEGKARKGKREVKR